MKVSNSKGWNVKTFTQFQSFNVSQAPQKTCILIHKGEAFDKTLIEIAHNQMFKP